MILWNQNLQLMNMLSHSSDQDVPLTQPHEYYPELFGEEIQKMAEEAKRQKEVELHKAKMLDYMFRVNQKMKKRGESSGWNDT